MSEVKKIHVGTVGNSGNYGGGGAGGASWGMSLTLDDINSADFGVQINPASLGAAAFVGDRIDFVRVAPIREAYEPRPFTLESIGAKTYEPDV